MGILVNCDSCDTEFNASSKAAGKRVKCPACGENVRVPLEEDDEPAPVRRSSSGRSSSGRSSSSKNQKQNSNGLLLGLGIGGGGAAVLGVIVIVMMSKGGAVNPPAQQPTAQVAPSAGAPAAAPSAPVQPVVPQNAVVQPASQIPNVAAAPNGQTQATPMPPNTTVVAGKVNSAGTVPEGTSSSAADEEDAPLPVLAMTELVKQTEKSVVRIIVRGDIGASVGSGFVIDTDGSIMTNYHVIEGAKTAVVEFETGKKVDVSGFTTVDKERDLAIIKIDYDSSLLKKIRIAKKLPEKGEQVAAFGAPRGLSFTASDGIISAIRQTPEFNVRKEGTYLQTTSPISPGNSGGPLVNMRGEVVGVNSFKIEGENLNFAVSAVDIRDVIANRGEKLIALSPEALPRREVARGIRAENLAGTTKGNILLSQIRDVIIMMLPFQSDPSGRVIDFVESQVRKQLLVKAKWTEITRQSQVKGSTTVVVVIIYFRDAEKADKVELMCKVQIVARDVGKDGEAYAAIVWDEESPLGTIGPQSMAMGTVPEQMKKKITDFFNKIVTTYRKAQRDVESGK